MVYLRLSALLLALSGSALAASPSTSAILACTKVADDTQRLACFDREAAVLSDTHTAAAPKLTPEQKIGLSRPKVEALEAPPNAPPEPQIKNFTAAIRSVSTDGSSRQTFELDNGQVWRQTEVKSSFAVHPGDAVRISKAALGSFFMELESNKHLATRVSRVR